MSLKIRKQSRAFSLVEVVLAIGVLSLAVVALIGLFGPTISSVKKVVDSNLASSAVDRVNAELLREMSYQDVIDAVSDAGRIYFVWKSQIDPEEDAVELNMSSEPSDLFSDYTDMSLVGTPMAVIIERSDVNRYVTDSKNPNTEGYFPVYVSVYPIEAARVSSYDRSALKNTEPMISYTFAKTRSF